MTKDYDQRGATDLEAGGHIFTGTETPSDSVFPEEDTTDHPKGASFTSAREADAGDVKAQEKAQTATARARDHATQDETTRSVATSRTRSSSRSAK